MDGGRGELLECVVNVSEGRDSALIADLVSECGAVLLDLHTDADHHRSVFTMCGSSADLPEAVRALGRRVVESLDLAVHSGVHPRIGTLDVVPWVSLERGVDGRLADGDPSPAIDARARFATWAGSALKLPCFVYGLDGCPSLPEVRRRAWVDLWPWAGPSSPHPRAGACAVGARRLLLAYNLWLGAPNLSTARLVARELRESFGPQRIRSLALQVGDQVQVSCNLTDPWAVGPGAVFDFVASRSAVESCELVGLAPAAVLNAEPRHRWAELGLGPSTTIEARLEQAGLDGGRFD